MLAFIMSLFAFLPNLGGPDLIVILLIILVLFGAKKLPELAKGMGSAIKEFQKAKDEFNDELHTAGKTDAAKPRCSHAGGHRSRGSKTQPAASAATDVRPQPEPTRVLDPDRTDRV